MSAEGDSDSSPPPRRSPCKQRFPPRARIRRGVEIIEMHRKGRRFSAGALDVLVRPGDEAFPRLGIVVPRHRHSAVERNRLRRRLREIGRRELLPGLIACGVHPRILIRARPQAYDVSFSELRESLARFTEVLCSGKLPSV